VVRFVFRLRAITAILVRASVVDLLSSSATQRNWYCGHDPHAEAISRKFLLIIAKGKTHSMDAARQNERGEHHEDAASERKEAAYA
jgi:hypothetical protein